MKKIKTVLIIVLLCFSSTVFAQETSKTYCISSIGYKSSMDILKKELLSNAKRAAVSELFGEFINSFTKVENLTLTEDKIRAISVGFIRINGNPVYHQGKNLGEVCVKIKAYAKDDDFEHFKPKNLTQKSCVMEGDVKTIKKKAEEKAVLEAVTNFNQKVKKYPRDKVLPLLHEVKFSEGGFVSGTPVYCVRASGIIYPIEAMSVIAESYRTKAKLKDYRQVKQTSQGKNDIVFEFKPNNYKADTILDKLSPNAMILRDNKRNRNKLSSMYSNNDIVNFNVDFPENFSLILETMKNGSVRELVLRNKNDDIIKFGVWGTSVRYRFVLRMPNNKKLNFDYDGSIAGTHIYRMQKEGEYFKFYVQNKKNKWKRVALVKIDPLIRFSSFSFPLEKYEYYGLKVVKE